METTPLKPSIRRKPNGFLMVQVKGKFTTPKPLYANSSGLLLKIGSDPTNHIQIKKAEVAPFHAELRQVTFQGQSKVIIQDCRPNTDFLPILVGTQTVPSQSTMVIPQDMPNICIGSHKFVFLYTIPPMLLTMYPQLAQQEWMQYYNTTSATNNSNNLSQSQTITLSQSMELPPSAFNVIKKEETTIIKPEQQYSQEKTLTASTSSGSMHSESEPETQPNNLETFQASSNDKSESSSEEGTPENATKDVPQLYNLSFSQREDDVEEEIAPSKPQPKSKKSNKQAEEHESNGESTIEGMKSSDKENLTSETSESEPASKKAAPKTPKNPKTPKKNVNTPKAKTPKSTKKAPAKKAVSSASEQEPSSSETEDRLVKEALEILDPEEESQSESSSSERVRKVVVKTPKKTAKTPSKSRSRKEDWTCGTCGSNRKAAMVDCQNCGAWHHCKCVGYNDAAFFWCDTCKATQEPLREEDDAECPVCKHAYSENPALTMVSCDGCERWYHEKCVGLHANKKKFEWMCEECTAEGRQKLRSSDEEQEEEQEQEEELEVVKEAPPSPSTVERIVYDPKANRKGTQSAKKASSTKKVTLKAPNTVAASKSRKATTTPKKKAASKKETPSKKAAPTPVAPSDSEGQEPSSSDESDSDEKENVFDTFSFRQKEGQFVPKISSKFAYFKSPPMDLAKTRLQQKTSPAPKKLF